MKLMRSFYQFIDRHEINENYFYHNIDLNEIIYTKEIRFGMKLITVIDMSLNKMTNQSTAAKSLENRLRKLEMKERIETIQVTELLRSVRIVRRVMKSWRLFL